MASLKRLLGLVLAARLSSSARGSSSSAGIYCEDIDTYFADLSTASEIDLGTVTSIECPANEDRALQSEILVESGKTVTIKSAEPTVRFINVRFTLEEGATLVFDIPETTIGPNHQEADIPPGETFALNDNASLTFMGNFGATAISNVGSLFENVGDTGISIEFKGDALFDSNRCNIFSRNNGILKFRGDASLLNNQYLGIVNSGEEGFVRFSKTATFIDNGGGFDGTSGCSVVNRADSAVIFRGDTVFSDHACEAPAVSNRGKMRFYGKAYFHDNFSFEDSGGGFSNSGDLVFKGAVQLYRNKADNAGAFASGGSTVFEKRVTITDNGAQNNGGAFIVSGGTVTFERPDKVQASGNYIYGGQISGGEVQIVTGCSLADVQDGTLTGFPFDDVCLEVTV
ncbi:unnamed protein product [Pylaiella littoralis]